MKNVNISWNSKNLCVTKLFFEPRKAEYVRMSVHYLFGACLY